MLSTWMVVAQPQWSNGVISSLPLNPPSDCLTGEFVGTPSDHCAKKPSPLYRFRYAAARHVVPASLSLVGRCPRAVSTVICIHNDSTTCPGNCSFPQVSTSPCTSIRPSPSCEQGVCQPDGRCGCRPSFTGVGCELPQCRYLLAAAWADTKGRKLDS